MGAEGGGEEQGGAEEERREEEEEAYPSVPQKRSEQERQGFLFCFYSNSTLHSFAPFSRPINGPPLGRHFESQILSTSRPARENSALLLAFFLKKKSRSHAQFAVSLPGSPTPSTPSCAQPVFFFGINARSHRHRSPHTSRPRRKAKKYIITMHNNDDTTLKCVYTSPKPRVHT